MSKNIQFTKIHPRFTCNILYVCVYIFFRFSNIIRKKEFGKCFSSFFSLSLSLFSALCSTVNVQSFEMSQKKGLCEDVGDGRRRVLTRNAMAI